MYRGNVHEATEYSDENVVITPLFETPYVTELVVTMQAHQLLRDHESLHPLGMEVVEGVVTLSSDEGVSVMEKGEVVAFDAGVKHSIEAMQDSILRVSLFLTA